MVAGYLPKTFADWILAARTKLSWLPTKQITSAIVFSPLNNVNFPEVGFRESYCVKVLCFSAVRLSFFFHHDAVGLAEESMRCFDYLLNCQPFASIRHERGQRRSAIMPEIREFEIISEKGTSRNSGFPPCNSFALASDWLLTQYKLSCFLSLISLL